MMQTSGILIIDKDKATYSSKVVEKVRKILRGAKVGHLGTLDPICTGLLPLCIGKATRFSQLLMRADKVYETTLMLGIETTTYDSEGELIEKRDISKISIDLIQAEIKNFIGEIMQVPPFFSSKKYKGQPLYKYARAGKLITLEPVPVKIYSINLVDYKDGELKIVVHCSAGTYIRSLAHDIGQRLGCGAHCKEIRRIKWKKYDEKQAVKLSEFKSVDDCLKHMISLNEVLSDVCGYIELEDKEVVAFKRGMNIPLKYFLNSKRVIEVSGDNRYLRAIGKGSSLLGIFILQGDILHPYIVL